MLKRTIETLRIPLNSNDRRRLPKSSKKQCSENTDKWHLCKAGGFSYGESPPTPPLEGTSLHRWNNSVERPWGILSLFTTCLQVQSHTKKTQITRRAGTWVEEMYKNDPYEVLNRAKPLSNNNSWADDGQSKSPKMKHSNQKGALRKPLWEEQSPTKC